MFTDITIGDLVAKYSTPAGWALLIGIVWRFRGSIDEQLRVWKIIDEQTKSALTAVATVRDKVDVLQNKHLRNIEIGLEQMTKSNDDAVLVLRDIKEGICVLVDRNKRENIDKV